VTAWSLCPEAILSPICPDADLKRESRKVDRIFVNVGNSNIKMCRTKYQKKIDIKQNLPSLQSHFQMVKPTSNRTKLRNLENKLLTFLPQLL
jgi:hypothetical protein